MAFIGPHKKPRTALDAHFRYALMTALVMGYAVLFTSDIYPLWYALPLAAAVFVGYRRFFDDEPFLLSTLSWTVLTTGMMLGMAVLIYLRLILVIDALALILLLLPLVRLFNVMKTRDHLQVLALGFAQIILATILNSTLWFGLVLAVYIVVSLWGLLLLSFKVTCENSPNPLEKKREASALVLRPQHVAAVALLGLTVLAATLIIFFVLPRPGSAMAQFGFGIQSRTSGFGGEIALGDTGAIRLDRSIAMWVSVSNRKPQGRMYWKGAVFDRFDGLSWSLSRHHRKHYRPVFRDFFQFINMRPREFIRQEVFLEGGENRHLFFHGYPIAVAGPFNHLNITHTGAVTVPYENRFVQRYTTFSLEEPQLQADTNTIERRFLSLPGNLDARIPELARSISAGAGSRMEEARRLSDYLRANYTYSLSGDSLPSGDPLARFLFERKSGHCEYYASALAVMLRSLGIPSLLVAGFSQGEYNEGEDVYIVRNSDAHAWVEALIDEVGWVRFDPTPPAAFTQSMASGLLEKLSSFIGIMRYRWQRYFLSYSLRDQFEILRHTGQQVGNINLRSISAFARAHLGDGAVALLLLSLTGMLVYRLMLLRGAKTAVVKAPPSRQAKNAMRQYAEVLELLSSRLSINRRASQTALEFARKAGRLYPQLREALTDFCRIYLELRFGANETAAAPGQKTLQERAREIRAIVGVAGKNAPSNRQTR